MKSKRKKWCKRRSLFLFVFFLLIAGWCLGMLDGLRRNYRYGYGGFNNSGRAGDWSFQQGGSMYHHVQRFQQFHHSGFHGPGIMGVLIMLGFWLVVLSVAFAFVRKLLAKRRAANLITGNTWFDGQWQEQKTVSAHADFLDEWERNLKNEKEEGNHGDFKKN